MTSKFQVEEKGHLCKSEAAEEEQGLLGKRCQLSGFSSEYTD